MEPAIERVETPAGDPAWRIARHQVVKALLADQHLGVTHPEPEKASWYSKVDLAGRPMGGSGSEYEEHTLWRKAMNRAFSPMSLARMAPRVRVIADELLDRALAGSGPVDLHETFSVPLCSLVICELLDVPKEDIEQFRAWTEEGGYASDIKRSMAGIRQLMGYVAALISEREKNPVDDPVSVLLSDDMSQAQLYHSRVAKLLAGVLGFGRETPASALDFAILLLLTRPDQWELLRGRPDLLSGAVEEALRLFRPPAASLGGLMRYAHTDIQVGDTTIRRGDMVLLDVVAANHDTEVFPEPERFLITRDPNPHLAFGHGFYMCNFTRLARVELKAALSTIIERVPDLRLAEPPDQLEVRSHLRTGGLARLPVIW